MWAETSVRVQPCEWMNDCIEDFVISLVFTSEQKAKINNDKSQNDETQ
jgi:hypothetical protein